MTGQCAECIIWFTLRDVATVDVNTVQLALVTVRLSQHMRAVRHVEPPKQSHDVPVLGDLTWWPERLDGRAPFPSSILASRS